MVETFWNWETLGVIIVLENKGRIGADSQIKKINENTWLKNKYADYFALIFMPWWYCTLKNVFMSKWWDNGVEAMYTFP